MATSDYEKLLARLAKAAADLSSVQKKAVIEAFGPLLGAGQLTSSHLLKVFRNNPKSDIGQLLSRPDVVQAINFVAVKSAAKTAGTVQGASLAGFARGSAEARAQAKLLGLQVPPATNYQPSGYLAKVLETVEKISTDTVPSLNAAAGSGFVKGTGLKTPEESVNPAKDQAEARGKAASHEVTKATRKLANRASAAASVAANRGYNEGVMAELAAIQSANPGTVVKKLWRSTLSIDTCPMCAALHGTVLEVSSEFSHTQSFGKTSPVFGDLLTPPRHPGCNCVIALYVDSPEAHTTAEAMRKAGKAYAEKADKMAPRAWSSGAPSPTAVSTDHMQASDFRNASDTKFNSALTTFRECMLG